MNDYINVAIEFCDLIRTTLGPKGMNKMVMKDKPIITNDGATIIKNLKGENPIIELFKELAESQESAIGDGTTTSVVLAGQLLQNAKYLINKGIHPSIIINGYYIANSEAIKKLEELKEKPDKEKIIKTAFGTKISKEVVNVLTKLLLQVKDYENLKIFKNNSSNPLESELYKGYIFEGFTLNDQMDSEIEGNIAVLDFRTNLELTKFNITNAEELEKVSNLDRNYKEKIVNELKEKNVKCVFYSDTNPEIESLLTENKITGIVVYKREDLDNICNALNVQVSSSLDHIHTNKGKVKYEKPNKIFIDGEIETLILNGSTLQTLEETERAIDDVISILKHDLDMVVGAGAIEIELANHLRKVSSEIGGKEQIAIEKFAESLEAIPLIIAENSGLDAMEVLTNLKTLHLKGEKDLGVDVIVGINNAREKGIFEPRLVKHYAISSATNVTNLILKLDKILVGDDNTKNKESN